MPRYRRGMRVALLGLAVKAALATVKLTAGIVGGSYALIADGVESITDLFGALVIWSGLRIAAQPPDAEHPYGHGKAEPLAAMIVGLMLMGAAIGIAVAAGREIVDPGPVPAPFTLWVLIGVIAVNEGTFQFMRREGRRLDSAAIMLDAWHHRSDSFTSGAALLGVTLAVLAGPTYATADDWAALVVSGVIVFNAMRLLRAPLGELMDAAPTEVTDEVRGIAADVPGALDVERVTARKSGGRYYVDMHLHVDPEMSVHDAHQIAHVVKDAVREALPRVADVLIHIEPFDAAATQRTAPDAPVPVERR